MSSDPLSFATRLMLLLALLAASLCGPAQAADYEVGESLVCDTKSQAERYVALFSGDAQATINAVNAEEVSAGTESVVPVAKRIQTMPASAVGSAVTITNGSSHD